jgi:hypothetical protein
MVRWLENLARSMGGLQMDPGGLSAAVSVAKSAEGIAVKGWWLRRASRDQRMDTIEELLELLHNFEDAYRGRSAQPLSFEEPENWLDPHVRRLQKTAHKLEVYYPWLTAAELAPLHDFVYYVRNPESAPPDSSHITDLFNALCELPQSLSNGWWWHFREKGFYIRYWVPLRHHLWRRWLWRDVLEDGA